VVATGNDTMPTDAEVGRRMTIIAGEQECQLGKERKNLFESLQGVLE